MLSVASVRLAPGDLRFSHHAGAGCEAAQVWPTLRAKVYWGRCLRFEPEHALASKRSGLTRASHSRKQAQLVQL